jgi:uncharacterized protein YkwD
MGKFSPMLKTNLFYCTFIFLNISLLSFTSLTSIKDDLAKDVLKYTNEYRKSKGLKSLEMKSDLNAIARSHSEAMASGRRSFGHGGYNQRQLRVQKIIQPYSGMAENVAHGAGNGKEAINVWKKSTGHRKNMLGKYKYIGIGIARNRRGVIYCTQIFVR